MPPCPLTRGVICFSLNGLSECSTRWSDEPTCKFFKSRLQGISRVATPLGALWPGPPPASRLPMSLTDRHTLSFSRFPTPASLSLHLCQRRGWQRRLGWKVSRAASGGETTPALLSYLWFCSCIVTLIWWQRCDCLTNEFPCPVVLRTLWWEVDSSPAYELTAAQMWSVSVADFREVFYQPTMVLCFDLKEDYLKGTSFTEMPFVFKSLVCCSTAGRQCGCGADGHSVKYLTLI